MPWEKLQSHCPPGTLIAFYPYYQNGESPQKLTLSGMALKERVLPLVGQLEQEVANAQLRVQHLKTECPSDWSPMKNDLDELFETVGSSVDRAWQELTGDIGG